jgi:hypothetical protein
MNAEPYRTRLEVTEHFGFGLTTLKQLEDRGLPAHRWSKRIKRYRFSEVDAWLRENGSL